MRDAVRETLKRAGFAGDGACLETTHGLFFPQRQQDDFGNDTVFVATDVSFNFGAPALLLDPVRSGKARLRDVGVFVGRVPEEAKRETVVIG
jgi:hypothetical protein